MSKDTEQQYQDFLMHNYGLPPVTLVRGEGSRVWDDDGRSYLDFCTGIAVNALGHCHPDWVERVREQAGQLVHCSNLYRCETQGELAQKLIARTGPGRLLFCNSGAEANEGLLKLARLHGRSLSGVEGQRYKVIVASNAFHGRTFGGMSATPQEKIQSGFHPMLDGFAVAEFNNTESFAAQVDDATSAILVETVQGEGGINVAEASFLRDLRELCDQHQLLLLIDEVQCGTGRSGTFFAYEQAGIRPDAIGMAKGLGGGFPIGAIWAGPACAELFQPGSHGTTFGGNPLACAAALAVLEVIERDGLLDRVREQAPAWHKQLAQLADEFPALVKGVRGLGYMTGVALHTDAKTFSGKLRDSGLLAPPASGNVVRLLPPLTATTDELTESVELFRQTLATYIASD